jgi:hypothetical protein
MSVLYKLFRVLTGFSTISWHLAKIKKNKRDEERTGREEKKNKDTVCPQICLPIQGVMHGIFE